MKKMVLTAIFAIMTMGFCFAANGGRADIDAFFKSYEEYVVAYEKAAKKNDLVTLTQLQVKSLELTDKLSKLQDTKQWTTADTIKYNELTLRLSKALQTQQNTTAPATAPATGTYNFTF